MKRFLFLPVAILMVASIVLSGACAQEEEPEFKELLIGTTVVLSGPAAWCGEAIVPAIDMAIQDINAEGGIKVGNDRYILRHVVYDDQYKPDLATANVQRMMAQGIKFINTWSTVATNAVQPITEEAGIITFNGASGSSAVNPDSPYTFRVATSSGVLAGPTYDYVVGAHPEVKKIAIINTDDDSGRIAADDTKKLAEARGLDVVAVEFYPRGTTDYYPVLTKVIAANPDFIDTCTSAQVGLILKQLCELGYEGYTGGSQANAAMNIAIAGAECADGGMGYMAMDYDSPFNTPKQIELWDRYENNYPGRVQCTFTYEYYDAIMGLAEAIEIAGTVDDTEKIRDTWADLTWKSVNGEDLYFTGEETYGIKRQISYMVNYGIISDGDIHEDLRVRLEQP